MGLMRDRIWEFSREEKEAAIKCPDFHVQKGNFVGRNGGFLSRINKVYTSIDGEEIQVQLWGPMLTRQPIVLRGSKENLVCALETIIDQVKSVGAL